VSDFPKSAEVKKEEKNPEREIKLKEEELRKEKKK